MPMCFSGMGSGSLAQAILDLYEKRASLKGMRIVKAPPVLRHFSATLDFSGQPERASAV